MKKIFFVALAATLLAAGCQKTEILNQVKDSMIFSSEMGKLTKSATAEGEANLQTQSFNVWALADFDDPFKVDDGVGKVYDHLEGVLFNYVSGSDNDWTSEDNKDYYWPGTQKYLTFFATSGVDKTKVNPTVEAKGANASLTVDSFTVTDGNTDVMVADFIYQSQESKSNLEDGVSKKSVDFIFHHALTKVEFLFKTEVNEKDDDIYVQNITVANVKTTAKLNVSQDAVNAPVLLEWDEPSDDADAKKTFTEDFANNDKTATDFPAEDVTYELLDGTTELDKTALKLDGNATPFATWLMMPQTIGDIAVDVVYVMGKRQFKSTFKLAAEYKVGDETKTLSRWNENQHVKYTITLTPNKITFKPTVDGWEAPATNVEQGN